MSIRERLRRLWGWDGPVTVVGMSNVQPGDLMIRPLLPGESVPSGWMVHGQILYRVAGGHESGWASPGPGVAVRRTEYADGHLLGGTDW